MKKLSCSLTAGLCAAAIFCSMPMNVSAAAKNTSAKESVSADTSVGTQEQSAYPGFPQVSAAALDAIHITYDLGGGLTYVLDKTDAPALLYTNADGTLYTDPTTGNYVINPYAELMFLKNLNAYVSSSTPAGTDFLTTSGRLIHFDKITTTGTEVNYQAECDYLTVALQNGSTDTHVLTTRSTYNIGDTYVEIDMTNQMLYYYKDGLCAFSTQIVTGNTSNGNATPQGVYKILNKATDTNLVGKNYVSHVDYWVPFKGNSIGIHDASWRSKFGGDIFLTKGSHGCINVPPENMKLLYPMLQVGTPVITFY